MKFTCLYLLVFAFSTSSLLAQKEYNIWYFNSKAGLDFNTNPVSVINSNKINSLEGSSGICDSNGNLLFYSNGDGIYNRNHQLMLNYSNPRTYSLFSSSIQSCIALKHPSKKSIYYLLVTSSHENNVRYNDSFLYYYVIDMRGDGGLGEVVLNEGKVMKSGIENIAVTEDSTKKEYWILTADYFTNTLKFAKTQNGEITGSNQTHQLNYASKSRSNIRISTNGKILAGPINEIIAPNSRYYTTYHLYKFNNSNGNISQEVNFTIQGYMGHYFEFSPNSRFLYTSVLDSSGFNLYQFDLSIWDGQIIQNSRVKISTLEFPFYGYQIGPDKKLYCFSQAFTTNSALSVIENPDNKGQRCNFKYKSIDLSPGNSNYGGPLYPSYKFRSQVIDLGPDTILCNNDSIRLFSFASKGDKIQWNTKDTTTYLWVKKPGKYYVTVTTPDGFNLFGSINIRYGSKPKVYIGNDTTFCNSFSHLIKAQKYYKNYKWNTGDSVYAITAKQAGKYSVLVKDSSNCFSADTIILSRLKTPEIKLSFDTVNCKYTYLIVDSIPNTYFVWNTNDTALSIKVELKGRYIVKAHSAFCTTSDTIELNRLSRPDVQFSRDTNMCLNPITISAKDSGNYFWSTGQTSKMIAVNQPKMYWLKTERNNCIRIDSINVKQDLPLFDLGLDKYICEGTVPLGANIIGKYLWNTGDTTRTIEGYEGRYILSITRNNCTIIDSINITRLEKPIVNLGPDKSLCLNQLLLSTQLKGTYFWSTGETSPSITINQIGKYSLTVSNGNCTHSDTINILECRRLIFYIPNSFTPNNDGINDLFKVDGEGINNVQMQIFNRWGEEILYTNEINAGWDGTYQNINCQQDIYMYKIKIEGNRPEDIKFLFGTVTLIR